MLKRDWLPRWAFLLVSSSFVELLSSCILHKSKRKSISPFCTLLPLLSSLFSLFVLISKVIEKYQRDVWYVSHVQQRYTAWLLSCPRKVPSIFCYARTTSMWLCLSTTYLLKIRISMLHSHPVFYFSSIWPQCRVLAFDWILMFWTCYLCISIC